MAGSVFILNLEYRYPIQIVNQYTALILSHALYWSVELLSMTGSEKLFLFQSCALYWPEEYGYTVEYGPLSIELLFSSEADTNITVRTFKLTNTLKVR